MPGARGATLRVICDRRGPIGAAGRLASRPARRYSVFQIVAYIRLEQNAETHPSSTDTALGLAACCIAGFSSAVLDRGCSLVGEPRLRPVRPRRGAGQPPRPFHARRCQLSGVHRDVAARSQLASTGGAGAAGPAGAPGGHDRQGVDRAGIRHSIPPESPAASLVATGQP